MTVLYEQLAFGDVPDDLEDQNDDQEQEFVISPERLGWLEDLECRVGELARNAPRAKSSRKRRGGRWTAAPATRRARYPPRYGRRLVTSGCP